MTKNTEAEYAEPAVPMDGNGAMPSKDMEALRTAWTKKISGGDVELPPMSSLTRYASRLRTTPDISSKDLQLLIEGEPAVASQVIRLANTAYYKPQGPRVSNLRLALVRLGNRTVANLIETVAMSDFYQTGPELAVRQLRKMWTATLFSAIAARELARWTQTADPEDAYLLGLFHNVGEPLLIRLLAGHDNGKLLSAELENDLYSIITALHEPLGRTLLNAWNFPPSAVNIVGARTQALDSDLVAIVCLAYESALTYGYTYFNHVSSTERATEAAERLHLDPEDVASIPQRIGPTLNEALGITTRS